MSALSDLKGIGTQVDVRILAPFFWKWYHKHANDMILKRKIVIFSVTIRVRDLRVLFEQLFGPEPTNLDIAGA